MENQEMEELRNEFELRLNSELFKMAAFVVLILIGNNYFMYQWINSENSILRDEIELLRFELELKIESHEIRKH